MVEQFESDLILSPLEIGIDLKILITDIFNSFRNVTKLSIKFKAHLNAPKEGRKYCEISCKELFEGLKSKSVSLENLTLLFTQHFDWRIFFIRFFTTEYIPLLKEFEVSYLHFLDPDLERALSSILNIEHLECLSIRHSSLGDCKEQLQFWNLPNLKLLDLQSNELTSIPASVGMLNKLEILNVDCNIIPASNFPFTLLNCGHLREIHYQTSRMDFLPFILQKLPKIKIISNTTAKYREDVNQNLQNTIISTLKDKHRKLFNALSLQILACEIIIEQNPTCWQDRSLAPLLCRVLDRAIERCKLCFVCNNVYSHAYQGFILKSVLHSFLGLSIAAFMQWCCSEKCIESAKSEQKELNATLSLVKELEDLEINSYYEEELTLIRGSGNYIQRPVPRRKEKCIIS
ncbi:hypothetical protein LOD99_4529 [Oopsacas minuta]|uniref:Uncharacterized protein n=1 Tax=Oopsacas minuta TaxID=111878 RepID=A0AAV7JU24_9METZ|nr:hypothetical protein LOD99_4529 [Oopsacas minuta]